MAQPAAAYSQANVMATVRPERINLRSGPGLDYAVVAEARESEQLPLRAISEDGLWAKTSRGWLLAGLIDFDGEIEDLRIVRVRRAAPSAVALTPTPEPTAQPTDTSPTPPPTPLPTATSQSPTPNPQPTATSQPSTPTPQPVAISQPPPVAAGSWPRGMPVLNGRQRAIYQTGVARGRNARIFTHAADSNTEGIDYRTRVSRGEHGLSGYPQLPGILNQWQGSLNRDWIAVRGGFGAWTMVQTTTLPACAPGETRYACDLRTSNASVVFIQLGTGDKFEWRNFDANLRSMVATALTNNVLPVLVTKADNIESVQGGASDDYINGVIRRVAAENDLPLIDFWQATRTLPVVPNPELPKRPFTQNGLLDEWGYYFHLSDEAKDLRVLMTLLVLGQL